MLAPIQRTAAYVTLLGTASAIFAPAALGQIGLDPPQTRKPPVAILINGYTNANLQGANVVIDKLEEMDAETPIDDSWTVAWNNLYSNNDGGIGTDDQMLGQLADYINSLPTDQPIILMGHSFGGDTLLKLYSSRFLGIAMGETSLVKWG